MHHVTCCHLPLLSVCLQKQPPGGACACLVNYHALPLAGLAMLHAAGPKALQGADQGPSLAIAYDQMARNHGVHGFRVPSQQLM